MQIIPNIYKPETHLSLSHEAPSSLSIRPLQMGASHTDRQKPRGFSHEDVREAPRHLVLLGVKSED